MDPKQPNNEPAALRLAWTGTIERAYRIPKGEGVAPAVAEFHREVSARLADRRCNGGEQTGGTPARV